MNDPNGVEQNVVPLLYAYVTDYPESSKVTATYSAVNCSRPCSLCLCPGDELDDVTHVAEVRTEEHQQSLMETMRQSRNGVSTQLQKEYSTFPVNVSYQHSMQSFT